MDDPNLVRVKDPNYPARPEPFDARGFSDYQASIFRAIRGLSAFFPSACLELVGSETLTSFTDSWHECFISTIRQMIYQVS